METRRDICDENYLLDKKYFFNKDYIRSRTVQTSSRDKSMEPFLIWKYDAKTVQFAFSK